MNPNLAGRRKRGKPKTHPLIAPQTTELDYDADPGMQAGSAPAPSPSMTYPRRRKKSLGKSTTPAGLNAQRRKGGY